MSNLKQGLATVLITALASTAAYADEEVDRTINAAAESYIEIYNTAGDIAVVGWSRKNVQVTGTLGDDVTELIIEREGDEILIKVKVPNRHHGDIDADLEISVPQKSSIEVSGVSTDIEVEGILGKQSLQTVSGDVETSTAEKDVEATSVSGDIEVTGSGKDADTLATTVSGDVILIDLAGSVEATTVSGDVEIIGGSFDDAVLEAVNGDLSFGAELQNGGDLSMNSVNGSIDVEFAEEVSARFEIETFNGSIDNCFGPEPERTSRYSPGLELSFTVGEGDSSVVIETLNGSIDICQ